MVSFLKGSLFLEIIFTFSIIFLFVILNNQLIIDCISSVLTIKKALKHNYLSYNNKLKLPELKLKEIN